MGQLGFFDLNRRYESLDKKSDPLAVIAAMVPFESFRPKLKAALIQGCSTLFTEGHRKYGFETAESGGVAVLRDCVGLIEPENIVGEASNSREDARIFSNARCVFA